MSHRRQFVLLDSIKSSTQDIPIGIPQGSYISVLLSILLINDLASVSNNKECRMFANDTSILCFGSNLNQLYTTIIDKLKVYSKWFNANELSINAKKPINPNKLIFRKFLVCIFLYLFLKTNYIVPPCRSTPVSQNEARQLSILKASKFIASTYYVSFFFKLKHLYILAYSSINNSLLLYELFRIKKFQYYVP